MNHPYAIFQKEKEVLLLKKLNTLTQHHVLNCPDYARILDLFYSGQTQFSSLKDLPYFPVNLFKTRDLLSIKPEEVFKVLKSSGTTSSYPSKIFLDSATAQRQTKALAEIMTSFLGDRRLPMLIIDNSHVIKDRQSYSARGAAIVGMMTFGRDFFYALDDQMNFDHVGVQQWLHKHQNESLLLFGMTSIVWSHFLNHTSPLNISKAVLMHTGGWKKMEEHSVDNKMFKEKVHRITQISECHNFYGMVEQVGSVFVECEEGHLHCPYFADVIIRDPISWVETQNEGVVQVLSSLPTSYPGHSLLTEDLGVLIGVDSCPCGRRGKYFHLRGRVPKAEMRGCSDTYSVNAGTI